jgi:hypothetical protein
MATKDPGKKYPCPHEGCDRSFDSRQALDYHKKHCDKRPAAVPPKAPEDTGQVPPGDPPGPDAGSLEDNRRRYESEHHVSIPDPGLAEDPLTVVSSPSETEDDEKIWLTIAIILIAILIGSAWLMKDKLMQFCHRAKTPAKSVPGGIQGGR